MMKFIMLMSMLSMMWWRNQMIMMLMSLEMVLLSSLLMIMNASPNNYSLIVMLFLAMSVILASLGLSMLVSMSRTHKSSLSFPLFN